LLTVHGLTQPKQAVAATSSEAASKAKEIGFPVALKLVSPQVVHKTEAGGVVLGLRSAEEAQKQGEQMLARAPAHSKLQIQEMVSGTEMLLGTRVDPQYGPVMMVGLGGIFVEVLKDFALRLLPIDEAEAREMLAELKGYPVLNGVRGQPARDVEALVRAITGLSKVFLSYRSLLSDLEVNPLIVREAGRGVAAVDVRLVRKY
jgi:acetyltransferase